MTTKIKRIKQLELIKQAKFSCVFFHMDGCVHCDNAKPIVQQLSKRLPDVKFFTIKADAFPEALNFYTQYAEFTQSLQTIMDDGKPALDPNGNVITVPRFDDKGLPVMEPVISIPQFYLMAQSEIDEDNEYGLVGKVN